MAARQERRDNLRTPEIITPLDKIIIANRGEMAQRILDACAQRGIGAVLAVSDADTNGLPVRTALALQEKDDRFAVAYIGKADPNQSYNNAEIIRDVALAYNGKAVHPGYGFLAERADAAKLMREHGIRWIGPTPEAIEAVGDKGNARALAKKTGVPLLPGTDTLTSWEQAKTGAERIKYPVMVKAQNAGGGMGNVVATNETQLRAAYEKLGEQFNGEVYLEKYVAHASHLEIQVAADKYGNIATLGERDCSAQRRFQKVLEESPALSIAENTKRKAAQDAIKMARNAKYSGLGTWEFIVDQDTGDYYFMEVNTRIQVEHPVTEERLGINLIDLQLAIEEGYKLPTIPEQRKNHVIEVRLYAEKPEQGFVHDAGTIQLMQTPTIEGVRIDKGYEEGDTIPQEYDKTILKFIATGNTREEAREKLAEALVNTTITGVSTNKEFLLWLIDTKEFREGEISTTFIEDAWRKHQRERFKAMEDFLEGFDFFEQPMPVEVIPEAQPQNLTYERRGVARNYKQDLQEMHEIHPDTCAFRFGPATHKETGIKIMFGFWDFDRMGGTLGVEEGHAVKAMFEHASKNNLPVVMISNSGGARQPENSRSLLMMPFIVAASKRFPVSRFFNFFSGANFGGLNASIAGQADIKGVIDGSGIGLTGPDFVAKIEGKTDRRDLPVGAHSGQDHWFARRLDVVLPDLTAAKNFVLQHLAVSGISPVSPTTIAQLPTIRSFDSRVSVREFNRPPLQRSKGIIGLLGHAAESLLHRARANREQIVFQETKPLRPSERYRLLLDAMRPTAADFLDTRLPLFDYVSPLTNLVTTNTTEQYPPIIGAIAHVRGVPGEKGIVYVLGQQPQRRINEEGKLVKEYIAQRPEDYWWANSKARLAAKDHRPILLLADTMGAAAGLPDEYHGVSDSISDAQALNYEIPTRLFSANIAINCSGGGIPYGFPANSSADFENALTLVSQPPVFTSITNGLTDRWPTQEEETAMLDQLVDATAPERLRMGHIRYMLTEPVGGIQTDIVHAARELHRFLVDSLRTTDGMTAQQAIDERYERLEKAALYGTRPTPPRKR